jgi:hypothetical protein
VHWFASEVAKADLVHVPPFQGGDKFLEALLAMGWMVSAVAPHTALHSAQSLTSACRKNMWFSTLMAVLFLHFLPMHEHFKK